ncbi:MAG: DISARM system helicase DrmA [Chloroflexales bacterium]
MTTNASSFAIREALIAAMVGDLLGPADGEDEIVDEQNVRGRYLVGMLAPRDARKGAEETEADAGVGLQSEDGVAEGKSAKAAMTMQPSSIGLSFTVAPEATTIRVRVRWGRYTRETIREPRFQRKDGGYRRVWKRQQFERTSRSLPLDGSEITWYPVPDQRVHVQGTVRTFGDTRVVSLFLVNEEQEEKGSKDAASIFQPELIVDSPDGAAIFQRRQAAPLARDPEDRLMAMLYRRRVEFAAGHGVAVEAAHDPERFDRARELRTAVIPRHEVPQTTAVSMEDPPELRADHPSLAQVVFDMRRLGELPDGGFAAAIGPLLDDYATWIARQEQRIAAHEDDLTPYADVAPEALRRCRVALGRMRAGLALLDANSQAAEAFRFANWAMYLQRVHSLFAAGVRRGAAQPLEHYEQPTYHSWRPFQLGFILLNLPSLTEVTHPERAVPAGGNPAENLADLLWFPTGGGKTEAYLGLTAYTIAIRRLQGAIGAFDHGQFGVAVLMRYTLRLLTLQQFQRAAALICACEVIRREAPERWGDEPIRLGLWVGGRATPNTVSDAERAIKDYRAGDAPGSGTPHQLTSCPWCGTPITAGIHLDPQPAPAGLGRVLTYCGSLMGDCLFNRATSPGEGLPVMVVDDDIYRRLPALLIATVDKFAQMPWNGKTAMLFGKVRGRCQRHGFRSPDIEDKDSHPASARYGLGPARTVEAGPLRPPDLIIQDELHLISGPLGTLVGLYETAVDHLSSWQHQGVTVRPKVIASTATIRRAGDQIHGLFWRAVEIFPPQGLDIEDSFFARQRPPGPAYPGRVYLGICSPGLRHRALLIQVYVALLAAAQQRYEGSDGEDADPWMTLVGYFNALRDLAAMRRSVDDSVSARLSRMDRRGLARRYLRQHSNPDLTSVQELTSRLSAADIPRVLDRLELRFGPKELPTKGEGAGTPRRTRAPVDVLLATNMISVGVDVSRLGLMVVSNQPKATAEYIQATSRVGRTTPGLVCTVYNWARPRDMSHYERFGHYHATFYQYVEALSVTPFSARALDRGLTGVLTALIRLGDLELNGNGAAHDYRKDHDRVTQALAIMQRRAEAVGDLRAADLTTRSVTQRLEEWERLRNTLRTTRLSYRKDERNGSVGLLTQPDESEDWGLFTCLNSLRDVEQTANLVIHDHGNDGEDRHPWTFAGVATPPDEPESEDDDPTGEDES